MAAPRTTSAMEREARRLRLLLEGQRNQRRRSSGAEAAYIRGARDSLLWALGVPNARAVALAVKGGGKGKLPKWFSLP